MYYPILFSMIAAAAAGVPANEPDPTIRITLNNEGQYLPGDRAKVQVISRDDGYLVVFRVSPEGKLRVLFPLDPTDDNYVKGGKRYLLLGRGGREGFVVDAGGTGVIFAAVSLDPWRYSGYVQNDHWNYAALNTSTYDDTETDLVNLAQGMAGGRFDYDILAYTVASQQVATVDEQVDVAASVGFVDSCFGCVGTPVGVVYGTGYYNTWGLYDPWYYSPYYNYGPYYPAWAYGPNYGWGWGWGGCYGYYCNGGGWGNYYPPYPTAVPYSPYQKKTWDRTWNGSQPPYRPRGSNGYTATNTVAGQLPGIGVQQHASFRDRTWAATAGGTVGGTSTVRPSGVPVSKTNNGASGTATGGRRREAATTPASSSGSSAATRGGSSAPIAVPSRPRPQGSPSPTVQGGASGRQNRATSTNPAGVAPATKSSSDDRRYQMPVEWTRPSPPVSRSPTTGSPPVSRPASEAPAAGTKASGEGRSSEPVLKRRDPEQGGTATAPAPATRQDNSGQPARTPDRGYSPPPPSQPSPGYSGGGSYGGSGGRAAPSQPSSPPSAVSGGGGGRRR